MFEITKNSLSKSFEFDFTFFSEPQTNLHLFDGNISNDYYINALDKVTYKDSARVEGKLRSGEMLCFDGEEDLDGIMNGDFSPMNRSDCALRFNEVFRWAWESWRMAVGPAIAKIYPNAIGVMNVGARANGNMLPFPFTVTHTN